MRCLQANVQSLNTSKVLLELAIQRHQPDVLLLQEIWHPKEVSRIKDFVVSSIKTRKDRCGGGVAIYIHKNVKFVPLPQYEVDGLEAVWAEVMCNHVRLVVGSVYVPLGEFKQMKLFGEQLSIICKQNSNVMVGMDANARNLLWDDNLMASQYGASRRMGDLLNEFLDCSCLQILNDGTPTYITESSRSALDITACKCNQPTKWKVVDDDIRSDHRVIITEVGADRPAERITVKIGNRWIGKNINRNALQS